MELTEKRSRGRPRTFDREKALRSALTLFWERGYAPTSVADLCKVMHLNPPSLYSSFGNKSRLFLEAVDYYEKTYWDDLGHQYLASPDIYSGTKHYFTTAAKILLSPDTPCGCLVVLAAINIAADETEVISDILAKRLATKALFAKRIIRAIDDGQLLPNTDVATLSGALNTYLEGLSIQARDGIKQADLVNMAALAVQLLPSRS